MSAAGRFKHVIFDLDGTLVDSAPGILAGFAAVLAAHGLEPRVPLTTTLIGPPLLETLMKITGECDPARVAAYADTFKRCYDGEAVLQTAPYDGAAGMLAALVQQGVTLHLATNKRLVPTRRILVAQDWARCFASVYALDMVEPRLPDKAALLARQLAEQEILPEHALYVGDKPEDAQAAAANQLAFVAVDWGYGDWSGWNGIICRRPADVLTCCESSGENA